MTTADGGVQGTTPTTTTQILEKKKRNASTNHLQIEEKVQNQFSVQL